MARQRRAIDAVSGRDGTRAGIEGKLSQAVRTFGLRRRRYRGPAKTPRQQVAAAAAPKVCRLAD